MRENYLVTGGFRYYFTESQALPVSISSVNIAALGYLKRVTGRIFKISKYFQRSKLKPTISADPHKKNVSI